MKRKILFAVVLLVCALSVFTVHANEDVETATGATTEESPTLTQHATPTGLKWNINRYGEVQYGVGSWDFDDSCDGQYDIAVYRQGDEYPLHSTSYSTDGTDDGRTDFDFSAHHRVFTQSGTYYFTVVATGDNETYSDSAVAVSENYVYTLPVRKLDTPQNVTLTKDCIVRHSATENASHYVYTMRRTNGYSTTNGYGDSEWIEKDLSGWSGMKRDGEHEFTVRAISSNIELYQNSDESASIKVTIENGVITKIDGEYVGDAEEPQISMDSNFKITLKGDTLVGTVYAALYGSNGSLKELKSFKVDTNEFTPSFSTYEAGDKVKAMWWDDALQPKCEPAE